MIRTSLRDHYRCLAEKTSPFWNRLCAYHTPENAEPKDEDTQSSDSGEPVQPSQPHG